jgi:hypothetical protein
MKSISVALFVLLATVAFAGSKDNPTPIPSGITICVAPHAAGL